MASSNSLVGTRAASCSERSECSITLAASISTWYWRCPVGVLERDDSPCSVSRIRPLIEPAAGRRWRDRGSPARLTEPPRPWKKEIGTPSSSPSLVRRAWPWRAPSWTTGSRRPCCCRSSRSSLPACPQGAHRAAHHRNREQFTHDVRGAMQVLDRFEQRHDRQGAALGPGLVAKSPASLASR